MLFRLLNTRGINICETGIGLFWHTDNQRMHIGYGPRQGTARDCGSAIDGSLSNWISVDSGMPEDRVLGPLLFLAHMNNLPKLIHSQCWLFAICLLYRPIHSKQDQLTLQNDCKNLDNWAHLWGMHFNASKCQVLHIQ